MTDPKTTPRQPYMGQIHAECDCPTPETCVERCAAAEVVHLSDVRRQRHMSIVRRLLKATGVFHVE